MLRNVTVLVASANFPISLRFSPPFLQFYFVRIAFLMPTHTSYWLDIKQLLSLITNFIYDTAFNCLCSR